MQIKNSVQLKEAIVRLRSMEGVQKTVLVDQFHETCESFKPMNLIKSAFHKVTDSPDLARKVVGASVGLGAGALTKKLLIGKSTNIFKKLFGVVLEFAVANVVAKNSDGIKRQGMEIFKKLSKNNQPA